MTQYSTPWAGVAGINDPQVHNLIRFRFRPQKDISIYELGIMLSAFTPDLKGFSAYELAAILSGFMSNLYVDTKDIELLDEGVMRHLVSEGDEEERP